MVFRIIFESSLPIFRIIDRSLQQSVWNFFFSLCVTSMALKVVDQASVKDALKTVLAPGQTRGWYEKAIGVGKRAKKFFLQNFPKSGPLSSRS